MVAPVLMTWDEVIDVRTAVIHSGKSDATIRRLCKQHGLSRQTTPHAPLEISLVALEMALHGDFEAIQLLREGHRSDERVTRYYHHLGLPIPPK